MVRNMDAIRQAMLALAVTAAVSAQATSVGVLLGRSGHNTEWDREFDRLEWDVSRYECTPEGMKEFGRSSASLDFVLVPPLFNWRKADGKEEWLLPRDGDYSCIRRYVENGGMIVVTEAQYAPCHEFFEKVDPCFKIAQGKCTSTPWVIHGHTSNVEPPHPLRSFPNTITERDSWAHFVLPKGSKWRPIGVCSEGQPIAVVQDCGKGCVVFTSLRHNRLDALENYYAYAMARKCGVTVTKCALPPVKPGDGRFSLELADEPPGDASLSYEFKGAKGDKAVFSTNIVGRSAVLDFNLALRGPVRAALNLVSEKGKVTLFTRSVVVPPFFAVKPNWYRGLLSTKRRVETVDFKIEFAPNHEELRGASVVLDVFDGCSNKVSTVEHLMPTNGEVALEQWLPVPLAKDLGAGGYRIDATLKLTTKDRWGRSHTVKASAPFELLDPKWNQVMIDDDGTFLVNGNPWMPLGIYHAKPDESEDMDRIADIGFNSMQLFFNWYHGGWDREFPILKGVAACAARGLRMVYEGARQPKRPEWLEFLKNHPATLAYYVADEPCEGAEPLLEETNDYWHDFDKDHPTYIDSCRPDLFHIHQRYCDILTSNGGGIDVLTGPATMGGHKCCCQTPGCEYKEDRENPECYRAYFYQGLAQGLRGFFWYCWSQRGGGPLGAGLARQPKAQKVFKSMFAEAKAMFPGLLSTKRRPFRIGDKVWGMVCGDQRGLRYLILANPTSEPVEISEEIPELKGLKQVAVPFALPQVQKKNQKGDLLFDSKKRPVMIDQTIPIENGVVRHSFPAFGTLVYRW